MRGGRARFTDSTLTARVAPPIGRLRAGSLCRGALGVLEGFLERVEFVRGHCELWSDVAPARDRGLNASTDVVHGERGVERAERSRVERAPGAAQFLPALRAVAPDDALRPAVAVGFRVGSRAVEASELHVGHER